MEDFISGYIACALWCGVYDSDGNTVDGPLDDSDLTREARSALTKDARAFYKAHHTEWAGRLSDDSAGHDFWLTRNGHGAGFWDRGLGGLGDRLTKHAKVYGEGPYLCLRRSGKVGL